MNEPVRTAAMSPPMFDPPWYPAFQEATKGAAQAKEAPMMFRMS